MNSFICLLVLCFATKTLGFKSGSAFCTRYESIAKAHPKAHPGSDPNAVDYAMPNLKFIVTKDKTFVYLSSQTTTSSQNSSEERPPEGENSEIVYRFGVKCDSAETCPKIEPGGDGKPFSRVFGGLNNLESAFIQDDITYLFTKGSNTVYKFESTTKTGEIPEDQFWKNITHATVYHWKDGVKTVVSRFIPPKSPKGPPLYGFSYDVFNGNKYHCTVEVQGNYDSVNIVKHQYFFDDTNGKPVTLTLYSFGDYLVPTEFYGYLPLPNGDDIFNAEYKPAFVRKDGVNLHMYRHQNLFDVFGCNDAVSPHKRVLTDTRSDNIYPLYFLSPQS